MQPAAGCCRGGDNRAGDESGRLSTDFRPHRIPRAGRDAGVPQLSRGDHLLGSPVRCLRPGRDAGCHRGGHACRLHHCHGGHRCICVVRHEWRGGEASSLEA